MADKTPLKFDYDETTPSSLAEFTGADTVSIINGGTGVSSLALLPSVSSASVSSASFLGGTFTGTDIIADSISATTITSPDFIISSTDSIIAASVSATTVSSTAFTGGTFTGPTVSATEVFASSFASPGDGDSLLLRRDLAATYPNLIQAREGGLTLMAENNIALRTQAGEVHAKFTPNGSNELYYDNSKKLETADTGVTITGLLGGASSVSATDVSAVSLTIEKPASIGMPIPAPYGFVQMSTNGTATDTEQNVGIGCTTSETQSSTDDLEWDDTNKRWDVKKTGQYEITLSVVLTVAATTTVTLQLYSTSPGTSQLSADARVHSSIDPHIYTVSWIGTIAGGGYAYATTTDDGGTDITVNTGTSITVKRLE